MQIARNPLQALKSACRYVGLELRFTKQGHVILFLPLLVYNLLAFVFVILNYLINNVCYLQPNGQPEWDSPTAPPLKNKLSKERLNEIKGKILKKAEITFSEEDLIQLFDTLEPAQRAEMIGKSFRGHIVRANCFLDLVDRVLVRPLMALGFAWNKRYRTQHIGDPLLMSWKELLFFPFPIWGNVGLTSIIFRGKHQATMNYDHQPWQDFFRVLDSGDETGTRVYLGLWTAREKTGGWFTLTVRNDVDTI
jgi:hypothetical protein